MSLETNDVTKIAKLAMLAITDQEKPVYAASLSKIFAFVEQLNAAWGARYTTWDSDGGAWPNGRGLLDESGRSAWLGRDFYVLKDATPGVRADLDAFVGVIADKYFSTTAGVLRRKRPGHLIAGTATISPNAHPEILRPAGRWCDIVQYSNDGGAAAINTGKNNYRKSF